MLQAQIRQNNDSISIPSAVLAENPLLIPSPIKIDNLKRLYVYVYPKKKYMLHSLDSALTSLTIKIVDTNFSMPFLQAYVPVKLIDSVAKLSFTGKILPILDPVRNSIASVSADWTLSRSAINLNDLSGGKHGVKVGVISDDCGSSEGLLSRSQSATVATLNDNDVALAGFDNASDRTHEGLAMMEVVNSVYPSAEVRFASAIGAGGGIGFAHSSFASAIDALAVEGCKVIVDDMIFFDEPAFEDGPIAQKMNSYSDIVFVSAAGNWAKKVYTFNFDGQTNQPIGKLYTWLYGTVQNTTANQYKSELDITPGRKVTAFLQWDDPYMNADNDYDMYLVDKASGEIVQTSNSDQNGLGSKAFEHFTYTGSECWGSEGYKLVIVQRSGQTNTHARMKLVLLGTNDASDDTKEKSIFGHAGASSVITCSAVAATADGIAAYPWTSRGDVEIVDMAAPFANGGNRPIIETRLKPDVTSFDCVPTSVPTFPIFQGTSASAPHVAAMAALLFSAVPAPSAAEVRALLRSGAVDLGSPGVDNVFGAGRTNVLMSLAQWLSEKNPSKYAVGISTSVSTTSTNRDENTITISSSLTSVKKLFVWVMIEGYDGSGQLTLKLSTTTGTPSQALLPSVVGGGTSINLAFSDEMMAAASGLTPTSPTLVGYKKSTDGLYNGAVSFKNINPNTGWKLTADFGTSGSTGKIYKWGIIAM
jgi:hypothetical protein